MDTLIPQNPAKLNIYFKNGSTTVITQDEFNIIINDIANGFEATVIQNKQERFYCYINLNEINYIK